MSEGNLSAEMYSKRPTGKTPKLEGAIVTGRKWFAYESMLGVKPEVKTKLVGKYVSREGGSTIVLRRKPI